MPLILIIKLTGTSDVFRLNVHVFFSGEDVTRCHGIRLVDRRGIGRC